MITDDVTQSFNHDVGGTPGAYPQIKILCAALLKNFDLLHSFCSSPMPHQSQSSPHVTASKRV